MPRPPRNNPDGGIHHVTNHRAGDADLFKTDRDRFLFLTLMKEASEETGVEVLEYCLMPNHYHLIVRCPFGTLDKFMHHLQGNYARAFNYRHAHKGPVFRARYYNVLVTTDEQFQLVCRYVHRNPGELGFDIGTYPWSSFAIYKQHDCSARTLVRVEQTMIIGMFGSRATYVEFVETGMGHDKFSLISGTRSISMGTSTTEQDLERLCDVVCQITGTDNQTIRSSTRADEIIPGSSPPFSPTSCSLPRRVKSARRSATRRRPRFVPRWPGPEGFAAKTSASPQRLTRSEQHGTRVTAVPRDRSITNRCLAPIR